MALNRTPNNEQWSVDDILADVSRMRGNQPARSETSSSDDVDRILSELRGTPPKKETPRPAPRPVERPIQSEPVRDVPLTPPPAPADPMPKPTPKPSTPVPAHRITPDEILHDIPTAPTPGKKKPDTIFEEIKQKAKAEAERKAAPAPEVLYEKPKTEGLSARASRERSSTRLDLPLFPFTSQKTRVLSTKENDHINQEMTGQVPLPGFESLPSPEADSEEWEEKLRDTRSQRVKDFVLSRPGQDEEDDDEAYFPPAEAAEEENIVDDYERIEDAPIIRTDLIARRRSIGLRLGITLFLELLLLILGVRSLFFPQILGDVLTPSLLLIANAALTLAVVLVNASTFFHGLGGLLRLNVDLDTGAAVAILAALAHNGILFLSSDAFASSGLYVYNAAAVLSMIFNLWGKHRMLSRIEKNFDLVANEEVKKAVVLSQDEKGSQDMGRGIAIGDPLVCLERNTVNLRHYLDHSFVQDPIDESAQKLTPYILLAGLVGGIIAFFTAPDSTLSLVHAVTAFSAVSCVCVPAASLLAGNLAFSKVCRLLRKDRILLTGYDAVYDFANVSVMALNAQDIFPAGTVSLHQLKTFGNQSIDRALLDAAGLAITAGGPMAHIFDEIIEGQRSILPEVDTLVYEEKMGISGWVAGNRVLIGNRQLMKNHGIVMPDETLERRLCKYGQYPVYLANRGNLSAIFVVSYKADPAIAEALQDITNQGVSIAVYSCDPNVTPDLIEDLFDVPYHTLSVMGAAGRHAFHQASEPADDVDTSLAHLGGAKDFAQSIRACQNLNRSLKIAKILQLVLWILGLVASLLLISMKSLNLLSVISVLGFQLLSLLLVAVFPALKQK